MSGHQVVVPLVTPYQGDSVDRAGLSWLASRLAESGVTGVFVPGTTGEWILLSVEERGEAFFSVASSAIGGLRLIAGVSAPRPAESYRLAEEAASHGAHAVMSTPPIYYRPSLQALAEFYREVKRRSGGLPTYLYVIPSHMGFTLDLHVVESLVEAGLVDGIKATVSDASYISGLLEMKDRHPGFEVLVGGLEMLPYNLLSGGDGVVDAYSNILPGLAVGMVRAFESGDADALSRLQRLARRLSATFKGVETPSALKAVLEALGAPIRRDVRPPLRTLSGREASSLVSAVCSGFREFLAAGLKCP